MAVAMRGELAEQVVLHADRGCQYTSAQLAQFAREHNLARSVGRTAVLGQRPAGIILGDTEIEFYDRYVWPTKAAAKLAVGDWIERVYNRRRRHSALAMMRRSSLKTDSLRRQKPPDPVSTKRGQADLQRWWGERAAAGTEVGAPQARGTAGEFVHEVVLKPNEIDLLDGSRDCERRTRRFGHPRR